jgi:EAL domain-containing protein (putative c-di-GMP-specific phosphodiesterase class I)
LLVLTGAAAGRIFELQHPDQLLGRSERAQIALVDRGVSREHARLTRTEQGYFLHDLNSTNGTFVAGRKVVEQKLEDGDEIYLGPLVCVKFGFGLQAEQADVQRRAELGRRLAGSLQLGKLTVVYQPIVHLSTREVVGLEALPRWNEILPSEFVPAALTSGQIDILGRFVVRTVVNDLERFKASGLKLFISINLSTREALDPEIGDAFLTALGEDASDLVLDVPGEANCTDPNVRGFLERATRLNARLALQDFGQDHASLAELGELKFNQLKLDRKFVAGCESSRSDKRICLGGIKLAESLGARSVAVGIETEKQFEYLAKNECILGQGFYFSHPVRAEQVEALVRQGTPGGEIAPCG